MILINTPQDHGADVVRLIFADSKFLLSNTAFSPWARITYVLCVVRADVAIKVIPFTCYFVERILTVVVSIVL